MQKTVRYMNGNVYKVKSVQTENLPVKKEDEGSEDGSVQTGAEFMVLDDLGGEEVRPNDKLFRKNTKPQHAWGLTIHKFQVRSFAHHSDQPPPDER